MKKRLFGLLVLGLIVLNSIQIASAAKLGMNYYHETMMNSAGNHFIDRSLQQVSSDLDDIKNLTNNLKFYMNPLAAGNLDWVGKVNEIAKQKGIHTVVVMNTEDRILDNSNWQEYVSAVLSASSFFNGKIDEFIVGNEISLHTTLPREDLQRRVVNLINECKKYFSGPVSYQAFWYEKDNWKGYSGKIYFNLYEDFARFKTNALEMNNSFGSNAYVGEFGNELVSNGQLDSTNQANEIRQRWSILQATLSPIAYVFTYKEPSKTGFGLIDSNGSHLPSWNILSQSSNAIQNSQSVSGSVEKLSPACSGGNIVSDTFNGCRAIVCSSPSGSLSILACNKPDNAPAQYFEMYKQSQSGTGISICLGNTCISDNGYAKSSDFTLSTTVQRPINPSSVTIEPWYPQGRNYIFNCNSNLQATTYDWFFGDEAKLLGVSNAQVYHSYNSAGNFLVKCIAKNSQSEAASTLNVQVN